jgi:hypothetical protein
MADQVQQALTVARPGVQHLLAARLEQLFDAPLLGIDVAVLGLEFEPQQMWRLDAQQIGEAFTNAAVDAVLTAWADDDVGRDVQPPPAEKIERVFDRFLPGGFTEPAVHESTEVAAVEWRLSHAGIGSQRLQLTRAPAVTWSWHAVAQGGNGRTANHPRRSATSDHIRTSDRNPMAADHAVELRLVRRPSRKL